MKHLAVTGAVILLVCIGGTRVEAQGVASSFDQLSVLVKPGDKITVVDLAGREAEGRIGMLSRDRLTIVTGAGPREVRSGEFVDGQRHVVNDGIWPRSLSLQTSSKRSPF